MIKMLRLFQERSCVLSSQHENQDVATIGTLLDQFNLGCKKAPPYWLFTVCVTYFFERRREA